MIYDNKEYETLWFQHDQESSLTELCNEFVVSLTDYEQLFIVSYFWQGMTEEQIAPLIGLSNQTSVSDFKTRLFAKIRMLVAKEVSFFPDCIYQDFRLQNPSLYVLFSKLLLPININRLTTEKSYKYLLRGFIEQIISILMKNILLCQENCNYKNKCYKKAEQNHKKKIQKYGKLYSNINSSNQTLSQLNLQRLIKIFQFLLNWRVFGASD